jgi:hypothetical protein
LILLVVVPPCISVGLTSLTLPTTHFFIFIFLFSAHITHTLSLSSLSLSLSLSLTLPFPSPLPLLFTVHHQPHSHHSLLFHILPSFTLSFLIYPTRLPSSLLFLAHIPIHSNEVSSRLLLLPCTHHPNSMPQRPSHSLTLVLFHGLLSGATLAHSASQLYSLTHSPTDLLFPVSSFIRHSFASSFCFP